MECSAYRGRVDVILRRDSGERGAGPVSTCRLGHVLVTHLRDVRAALDPVPHEMIRSGPMVNPEFNGQVP
jgi:hypothetical protein